MFLINQFTKTRRKLLIAVLIILCLFLGLNALTSSSHAVSATNFNPSNIIDNSVFVNTGSMTADQIQSFLISKVSTCDTNGTLPATEYGYPHLTHAQYAATQGWSAAPYTCLRDYSENGLGSAQIIYNIAQKYQINPEVLIVLLQKEQSLVTDTWPISSQYKKATGYGCPDTAPCDSQYYGFTNQLTWAAKMYRAVLNQSPSWYSPYVLGTNFIRWSNDSSCGGSNVTIQNLATVALYDYTPYQPNAAALAAGYGEGDSCSAHGNRNFYLYFNDWFGATTGPENAWSINSISLYLDSNRTQQVPIKNGTYYVTPGEKIYLTVLGTNIGRNTWSSQNTLLGTSSPFDHPSSFTDSDWISANRLARSTQSMIAPNDPVSFNTSLTAPMTPGKYNEQYQLVIEGVAWVTNTSFSLPINIGAPSSASVNTTNYIASGSSMSKGQELLSPEGNSVLKFQEDGNLVLYTNFKAIWSTGTSRLNGTTFVNQPDGNLVLYSSDGVALWNSHTQSGASKLYLQPDGNLVLYDPSKIPVWNSFTSTFDQTNIINQSLNSGDILFTSQSITTLDRKYSLNLQPDGNLVLYSNQTPLWSTLTFGSDKGSYLSLQPDGNLVLYDEQGKPIWYSRTSGTVNAEFDIQNDGNLVLYNNMHSSVWSSGTYK